MSPSRSRPSRRRLLRRRLVALALLAAILAAAFVAVGDRTFLPRTSQGEAARAWLAERLPGDDGTSRLRRVTTAVLDHVPGGGLPGGGDGPGTADGFVPVGGSLSPFDDVPAITRLDPGLREAVRRAAAGARADGIELRVNSGWRSAAYQRSLFDDAVRRYGGQDAARRFVKAPEDSSHVTGQAVDIGPTDAAYWTIQHGAEYGLCQIYANEVWHFERPIAPGGTCPATRTDATSG
jgi:D-alanyl-D-alanine carboxypeptidase